MLNDGIHEAIISEEMWNQAHRKHQETGVLQVKTHSLEYEHILSGIIKCPVCESGMYGNVNRKKHPDGGYYKDYFYYACKHRKLVDGHRCTYKRQWNEDRINAAVEEIIRKCPYCIVGITDLEGNPYAVPMNFAYQDGVIYLHSGPEGSKVEMVTKHPQVCITFCEGHELVYMHRQVACSYSMKSRSVICRGKVHFVEDMEEKRRVLDMLMKQYTENECKYAEPAVRNVKIWEVKVEKISCRSFGLRPSEL